MMALTMLSRGVPEFVAGDEMGHTTYGNNNTWDQDKLNQLDWSALPKNLDKFNFMQGMIELRKSHQLGELRPDSFIWRGADPDNPDFSDSSRLIAWQTKPTAPGVKPLYSAFNSYWEPVTVKLPQGKWYRLVDTNLPSGQDIVKGDQAQIINGTYTIQPRSSIVLESR